MQEEFVYIDFKHSRRGRAIDRGTARLHYVSKNSEKVKNAYYCITLNQEISNEIKDKDLQYLRLRQNTITGEIYFVFGKEEAADAVKASFGRGNAKCISIYSKGLVETVINILEIPKEKAEDYILKIGENKSRIADVVCLQIEKFNV